MSSRSLPHHRRVVNPESAAAYGSYNKEHFRLLVLDHVRSCGALGVTGDEVAVALALMHNSVSPRLVELRQAGLICELYDSSGARVRRKTRAGCMAGVLVAKEFSPKPVAPTLFPEGGMLNYDHDRTSYPD